jgi:NMD protein affecting ribosome stability and mRNA decay
MLKKFCPKCGKLIKTGKFCNDCTEVSLDYKPMNIRLCPSMKYFNKGKWAPFNNLRDLTQKLLDEHFKQKVELETGLEAYELLNKPGLKKDLEITIIKDDFVYPVSIHVETTYSPSVAKIGSQYYEGILQVRNTREEIKKHIQNYLQKNKIPINDMVDKENSTDYYFVQKNKIQTVANNIIKNFSGHLDINEQLFSRNHLTSKDIYRINALLTIPIFKQKDVVKINDEAIQITNLAKEISGTNLTTGNKTTLQFNSKNQDQITLINKQKSQIINIQTKIQILNENYEPVFASNPLNLKATIGRKVNYVKHKEHYYLVK